MDSLKDLVDWILGALLIAIGWFMRREGERLDDFVNRIAELEKASVTHAQLDRLMERVSSERAAMHIENREHMQRIEDKIDANKTESAASHHELREELHAMAIEAARK